MMRRHKGHSTRYKKPSLRMALSLDPCAMSLVTCTENINNHEPDFIQKEKKF